LVEEVDVETDEGLLMDYGLRIPVVLGPDERVLAEGIIGRVQLRRELRAVSSG
jgi:hypothetical protein